MPSWLYDTAFHLFATPVTWVEVIGDVTGLVCVWWTVRQNIWNWPAGLLNNVFFFLLFIQAKLYGDAVLQVVFFALGVYGWIEWHHGRGKPELPVRRTRRWEWVALAAVFGVGWATGYAWLDRATDSPVPAWDSLVLILSLMATYGQAKKLLESWWLWIAVDVVSIPLYVHRDLLPTAMLYVVFLVLCFMGLADWSRSLKVSEVPMEVGA